MEWMQAGERVPEARIRRMDDWYQNLGGRCCDAREEDLRSARTQERGIPIEDAPVIPMRPEHEQGRCDGEGCRQGAAIA